MAVLEVKNLKKIYRPRFGGNQVQALSCVNFSVEEGRVCGDHGRERFRKDYAVEYHGCS